MNNIYVLIPFNLEPRHFTLGGDVSEDGSLNYKAGDEITWSCNSKKPVQGDTVYLIRPGEEARGLIARGTLVQESFIEPDFRTQPRQIGFVQVSGFVLVPWANSDLIVSFQLSLSSANLRKPL